MPVDLTQLKALYRRFNQAAGGPAAPSRSDRKLLEHLETLKVDNPLDPTYQADLRQPRVC